MRGSIGFFPYGAMDYKAAQDYLDRRAAAGWVLRRVSLGFVARFLPAEGRSHFVDLDLSRAMDEGPDPDYLQLCADAGWEKVQALRGMLIFRSAPGFSLAPIQTDEGLEQERFWKGYVRRQLVGSVLAVLLALAVWRIGVGAVSLSRLLRANGPLLFVLTVALLLGQGAWSALSTLVYYLRCRRAGRVLSPGRRSAAVRGGLSLLTAGLLVVSGALSFAEGLGLGGTVDLAWDQMREEFTATPEACWAYPVVTGSDLGLDDGASYSRYLRGSRSALADNLSYSELVRDPAGETHILTTERYALAGDALARWLLGQRKAETERGDFTWGELPWYPAPGLGFDESYTALGGSYLLLRQGNVVALAGASEFDLTSAQNLGMIRERLNLEES